METVIKVIFTNEGDAYAAQKALLRANKNFDVELEESYVVKKRVNGSAVLRSVEGESTGEGLLGGATIGGLFGLLGGPVGVGLGIFGGMMVGGIGDVAREDDISDYLNAFAEKLAPGETMLVAHLWEYSAFAADEILKQYGGKVTRLNVNLELFKEEQAAIEEIDREIAVAEAARAKADATSKAAWDAKVKTWKQKRADAKQHIKDGLVKRKEVYKTWVSGKKNKFEEWKQNVDEKFDSAKKERLQKRIDKQEDELQELQSRYEAI